MRVMLDITEHKQRERELEAIAAIFTALCSAPTRADMLPVILDQLLALLRAEGTALALRDPATGETVIELGRGGWASWTGVHLPPGGDVSGYVIATGQPHVAEGDAQTNSHGVRSDLPNRLRAVACVPLIAWQQTIGVIWIGRNANITKDELCVLMVVANMAASAIQCASLYERTVQLSSQLESHQHFTSRIEESIPSSLVVIDRMLRIVSVNRNFLEKARREARATLGRKTEEVFPQVLTEYIRLDQKVREVFRTGQSIEGGKVTYRAPGVPTRIYFYRLIPLKREDGVENVMLLMDDITEREQLGEEVRRAERHLAGVVECANDLVISMNPQGQIVTWNRAAETISGLKAEQVKGRPLLSLCAAEQQPMMADLLGGQVRGEGVQHAEVNLLTASGHEVPIAWNCSPMRSDTGQTVGIVAVGRDLTERRRLEAQLVQSAKMVSLGVMAGGIAHEIRNPLGIVSVAAQLLAEQPYNEELRGQCLQRIESGIQRAASIIDNLLRFSRPSDEQMNLVQVQDTIDDSLALLSNTFKVSRVQVIRELANYLPPILGNRGLIQQALVNVILNACQAMPDGGTLTLSSGQTPAGEIEIRVADTGCGIPRENLDKVFDPFFTTWPKGKGTGLGLAITYSIVQQHRGHILIESQVDRGTTVALHLAGATLASTTHSQP